MSDDDEDDDNNFFNDGWLLLIMSSLSFLVTTFIVTIYYAKQKSRSYGFTLVFGLCLSDLGLSLSIIFAVLSFNLNGQKPIQSRTLRCNLLGGAQNYFVVCSLLWTISISQTLYDTLINQKSLSSQNIFAWLFIFTFGLSGLNMLIPLLLQVYTPEQPFILIECAITNHNLAGQLTGFFNYIIYFWVAFFYNFVTIIKSKKYFKSNSSPSYFQSLILNMLYLYPMTLFVVYAPIMISRTLEIVGLPPPQFVVKIAYYTLSLGGFVNSLVYGYLSYFQNVSGINLSRANEQIDASKGTPSVLTQDLTSPLASTQRGRVSTSNSERNLHSSFQNDSNKNPSTGRNL